MDKKPTHEELEQRIIHFERESIRSKTDNETLQKVNDDLLSLLENSPNFITIADSKGVIKYINQVQPGLVKEEVIGSCVYEYIQPEYQDIVRENIRKVMTTGESCMFESIATGPSGSFIWYENHLGPIKRNDQVIAVAFIATDISKRREAEEALTKFYDGLERHVEERTMALEKMKEQLEQEIMERKITEERLKKSESRLSEAQRIAHLGNWDWDISENVLILSDEIYRIFGLEPQAVDPTYEDFLRAVHPDDKELVERAVGEALHMSKKYDIDHRIVLPDGKQRFVHERGDVKFNEMGEPFRMIGTVQDVTERKRSENALKESERRLRFLSGQLITAQEKERKRISLELHDDLGQDLMALKLQLRSVQKSLPGEMTSIRQSLEKIIGHLNGMTEKIRRLIRDLSPSILDDLGLRPALSWMMGEFSKIYKVETIHELQDIESLFSKEKEIMIFRIFQEALNNIGKHAHADRVTISYKKRNGSVQFTIEDNGKGFSIMHELTGNVMERGLGLSTMEERARMIGGKLDIQSQKNQGTKITLTVPVDKGE